MCPVVIYKTLLPLTHGYSGSYSWTISLEIFSDLHLHTQGWGPDEELGINLRKISAPKNSSIYLRPDDVFQIGDVILQVQREASQVARNPEVQVTSTGNDGAIENQEGEMQDIVMKQQDAEVEVIPAKPSTPGPICGSGSESALDFDTTIMETPAASRHYNPDRSESSFMFKAAEHLIKDDEDQQVLDSDFNNKDLPSTRGPSELKDNTPLPEESIDLEDGLENSYISRNVSPGGTNPQNGGLDPEPSKETLSATIKEYTVSSTPDSEGVKAPRSMDGNMKSNDEDLGESSLETEAAQSPPAVALNRDSRKRKMGEDESQDSMKSVIQVTAPLKGKSAKQQHLMGLTKKPNVKTKPIKSIRNSSEPPSSNRSTRSALPEDSPTASKETRVFFASSTSMDKTSKRLNFLEKQGVIKVSSVKDCGFLCVGKGDLKKTCNLVLAVISGKQVINDDWVLQSIAKGELLDPMDFLARDASKEAEWGIDLAEAIERGKQGVKPFSEFSLYFTSAAKKDLGTGFAELKDIALHAGAKLVQASLPRKSGQLADKSKMIIIAVQDDGDLSALEEGGWRCFGKDMVTLSVLRGAVDIDSDEFLIRQKAEGRSSKRRKR